jgi:arylsulfatase A-like enzyme
MRCRAAIILFVFVVVSSNCLAAERPNIIFFLSDDHRADVLGCAGHPIVKTPCIDKLAARGVRFSNAFVTTSICAASRATILTGLVERTHGYTFGKPPVSELHIATSYPVLLKDAGYRTGFIGKFGVKVEGGASTIDTMFDSFVATERDKQQPGDARRHFTDIVGDKAIEFIANSSPDDPFCLSVSFHAAHAEDSDKANHFPYPQAETGLYKGIEMPRPKLDGGELFAAQPVFLRESMNRDRYFWRWDTPQKYDRNLRNYFRMLSGLDRNIGRVMSELKQRGLADNTVIIFMSDNGYYMGERGFAGKWSHYEQSLRVPLVILDPRNRAHRGEVLPNIALNLDIAPTVLQIAGIRSPDRYQGISLTRLADIPPRDGFFCEHRMEHKRIPKWEGYRGKRYVYANYFEQESVHEFLHDLETDPDQLQNLVQDPQHADVLAELQQKTRNLSRRYANAR